MKPYDAAATCPKCGGGQVDTLHSPAIGRFGLEHMRRECRRCGYRWREAPLDQPPEKEKVVKA